MAGGTGASVRPGSALAGAPWLAVAVADRSPGRRDAPGAAAGVEEERKDGRERLTGPAALVLPDRDHGVEHPERDPAVRGGLVFRVGEHRSPPGTEHPVPQVAAALAVAVVEVGSGDADDVAGVDARGQGRVGQFDQGVKVLTFLEQETEGPIGKIVDIPLGP